MGIPFEQVARPDADQQVGKRAGALIRVKKCIN